MHLNLITIHEHGMEDTESVDSTIEPLQGPYILEEKADGNKTFVKNKLYESILVDTRK